MGPTAMAYVLNGPNLNLLGSREPEVYGSTTLADIEQACASHADALGIGLVFRQSNHEGALIDWLQEASRTAIGVVLNPGGFGHHSVALHDAVRACACPVIGVHLSNIHAREPFRRIDRMAAAATGVISGLGVDGYCCALDMIARRANPS